MKLFKPNQETIERRLRRKQHYLLSKKHFVIDNFFSSDFEKS